jgi:unsaturated chondroitin disaccharide hydrolase
VVQRILIKRYKIIQILFTFVKLQINYEMKDFTTSIFVILIVTLTSCKPAEKPLSLLIDEQLQFAMEQYKGMDKAIPDSVFPRSFDAENDRLITSGPGWWCSGFFPGSLWYLYEYSGDSAFREIAIKRTAKLENEKFNRGTHDLGFMLYCSFGNGLRIDKWDEYKAILITGANSLISRYNPTVGCIRSWDNNKWMFPVIIDNMMNLEYLFWAGRETGDSAFIKIATSHADVTMANHFRKDYSSWHVVDYDTITGIPRKKQTAQGFSDESAWSRGQCWGLYGFTMLYRETRDTRYLQQAENIAGFILNNPGMPGDLVPYWDFNAPGIPNEPRDASAAAILCSALIELSGFVEKDQQDIYLSKAEKIIRSLSAKQYRAEPGKNGHFILKHSVGSIPNKSEVDVPLSYADYYYIESLMRMKGLQK